MTPSIHSALFLAVRSQPSVFSAQQQWGWKYLIKCTYAGICIQTHKDIWRTCKYAYVHRSKHSTQTQWQCKSVSVEDGHRNLSGAILSPSAPRRHDQWGARDLSAASWVQSVRRCAEDGLGQRAGSDGTWVDGQSPSWWDEVHQRGEWKLTQQAARPLGQHTFLLACIRMCGMLSLPPLHLYTGERLFGEGERADVRAVWRNAAINAEAFPGNQGNELCNTMWLLIKLQSGKMWRNLKMHWTMCVCRRPIRTGGVWSQRLGSGQQPWRALIKWTAPLYLLTSTCR